MRKKPLHYETDAATVRREISFLLFSVFGSSYSPGGSQKGGRAPSIFRTKIKIAILTKYTIKVVVLDSVQGPFCLVRHT